MDKLLADNIKFLLLQGRRKQADLAAHLDVDPVTVNRWLNYKRPIKSAYIQPIVEFFGITVAELYNTRLTDDKPETRYNVEYEDYRRMVQEQHEYYKEVIEEEKAKRKELEQKVAELERIREELMRRLDDLSDLRHLLMEAISQYKKK